MFLMSQVIDPDILWKSCLSFLIFVNIFLDIRKKTKKDFKKKAHKRYQNYFIEEKEKQQYDCEQYKNLP